MGRPFLQVAECCEWRMVMSRGPDERAPMHAMSILLSTCEGMSDRVLIDAGANWILQGSGKNSETRQLV